MMKTYKQWWSWAVMAATLAFLLQLPLASGAQDAQVVPDSQAPQNPDAQNADAQNPDQDPPSRVARLNYMDGSVSFQPGGENDWVEAALNRPLVTGDNLWADENSRAEVHVGSTALRLGSKTGITLLEVSDHAVQIRLAQGSLIVKVRHVDDEDSYEIDTPNIAFVVMQPGDYRIGVDPDGNRTEVTVWRGRGQVTGGGSSYTVVANQDATFTGTDQQLNYDLGQVPADDAFDTWALDRDRVEEGSDSANYVSREMTGYEDLDEYGDWSYVAGYGPCWRPRALVAGWAPYRFGHWVYVGPWGWTWVEDEPWGFAPFHYGRWAFVNSGWFWVPGSVVVGPIWAPALVAFVGGGPNFRFSAGAGVGWFPLAPGEVYLPGYHVSRTYVNNVNITNTTVTVTRVTNVYNTVIVNRNTTVNNVTYVNQHVNNGVTVVSHAAFVNARPVAQNVMRVDQREIAAAQVTHVVAADPVRTSVMGEGRPAPVRPPSSVISRPVVAVRTPPPPPPPIEQRQAQAGGHLNQEALVHPVGPSQPAPTSQMRRPQQTQDGFRPFTQPNSGSSQVRQMPQTQPRVYEQQGTSQPENRPVQQPENQNMRQSDNRNMQPQENRNPQPINRPAPQETHPLVRSVPPVQERSPQQEQQQEQKFNQWHQQQRTAPPPQPRPAPRAPEPKQEKPPK